MWRASYLCKHRLYDLICDAEYNAQTTKPAGGQTRREWSDERGRSKGKGQRQQRALTHGVAAQGDTTSRSHWPGAGSLVLMCIGVAQLGASLTGTQ